MEKAISGKTAIFVLLFAFLCSSGFAGTAGNLVNFPKVNKFSIGLEYIDVEQRDIYEYDNEVSCVMWDVQRKLARVSYGIFPATALDFWFGEADYAVGLEENYESSSLIFDSGNMWGLGLRAKIFEKNEGGLSAGAGFQYYSSSPKDHYRNRMPFSLEPEEWQLSFDIAKRIGEYLLFYGGLRYSEISFPYTHPADQGGKRIGGYEESDSLGVFAGVEATFLEKFSLCLEKHLVDEESFIFSAGYKW